MDKILSTYNHGVCLFSVNVLYDFLKKRKDKKQKNFRGFSKR